MASILIASFSLKYILIQTQVRVSVKFIMIIHRTIESMQNARKLMQLQSSSLQKLVRIGFVPTMGALHDGHAKLIRDARNANDIVISSIFINPKQFGPNEDLDRYPRSFDSDVSLLSSLGVVRFLAQKRLPQFLCSVSHIYFFIVTKDHIFAPDANSMYSPNHCTYVDPMVSVTVTGISVYTFFQSCKWHNLLFCIVR